MIYLVNQPLDWQKVVDDIYPNLKFSLFLLQGNLGAGKTTFTQYLLQKMGVTDYISSPTYSLVNEYNTKDGKIFHMDLYRLDKPEEAFNIGIEEYLDHGKLCIIEWPEILLDYFKEYPHHLLSIDHLDKGRSAKFETIL